MRKVNLQKNIHIVEYVHYTATLKKMFIKKFPFSDTILKDLGIINPLQVHSYSFGTIKSLAEWFKQLELADSDLLDALRDEFMDYMDFTSDLPDLSLDQYYQQVRKCLKQVCFGKPANKNAGWRSQVSSFVQVNVWPAFNTCIKCWFWTELFNT